MKKILGAMAILVALGMGFVGCAQPEDQTKKDSGIPQKELPKSVGENPFKGNTYSNTYSSGSESYEFTENEVTYKRNGKTERVLSYTYNTEKKLLAFKLTKLQNVNGTALVTPEQYVTDSIGIISDEQKHRNLMGQQMGKPMTDAEWQEYINSGKKYYGLPESASYQDLVNATKASVMPQMNYYYSYTVDASSLKLKEYFDPALTLKQHYTDYAIPSFSCYENGNNIRASGNSVYVKLNGNDKNYTITDVTDTVIKAKSGTETVEIPYTMTDSKVSVKINNQTYTLSLATYDTTYTKQ